MLTVVKDIFYLFVETFGLNISTATIGEHKRKVSA